MMLGFSETGQGFWVLIVLIDMRIEEINKKRERIDDSISLQVQVDRIISSNLLDLIDDAFRLHRKNIR